MIATYLRHRIKNLPYRFPKTFTEADSEPI